MDKKQNIVKPVFVLIASALVFLFLSLLCFFAFNKPDEYQQFDATYYADQSAYDESQQREENILSREKELRQNLKRAFQQLLQDVKNADLLLEQKRDQEKEYWLLDRFKKKQQSLQLKRELNI